MAAWKGCRDGRVPLDAMRVQVISGPIASALLLADGAGGLKGWQWLFILEGLPTILLGFWVGNPLYI